MIRMTNEEKLDYILNLFKANKMDMQISTIKGLIPETLKPDVSALLSHLVEQGYLNYDATWWSATIKGKHFTGFSQINKGA